jgi:hypothetical protein
MALYFRRHLYALFVVIFFKGQINYHSVMDTYLVFVCLGAQ